MLAACRIPHLRILPLLLVGSLLLSACFDDDDDADNSDTAAPTAEIHFPGYVGLTEGDTVLVTGASTDASTITRVRVAGVDATSTDGFATWRAVVPLEPGDNELAVETTDEFSNVDTAAATLSIRSTIYMEAPSGFALDAARNRALVVDKSSVLSIDIATGVRTVFSGGTVPDASNAFMSATAIAIDSANNRVLVVDDELAAVVAVDLDTGARTILSSNTLPDGGNPFDAPVGITLDASNNRALVVDAGLDSVIAVDLDTGARSIFSDLGLGDETGINYASPRDIALDAASERVLVTIQMLRGPAAVMAVDINGGSFSVLSGDEIPDYNNQLYYPSGIAIDAANGRALLTDGGKVVAVDISTGVRTVLSLPDYTVITPGAAIPSGSLRGISVDAANNRALIIDALLDALVAVDLDTGTRTVLAGNSTPGSNSQSACFWDSTLDAANDRALGACGASLVVMDLTTGTRSILFDDYIPDEAPSKLGYSSGIAIDAANDRAIVGYSISGTREVSGYDAILSVDLASGAGSILSSNTIPDANNPLQMLGGGMTVDTINDRALVIDGFNSVLSVDLQTGARSVLSSSLIPAASNTLHAALGITVDSAGNRALVAGYGCDDVERCGGIVVAVDLDSGARTVLSGVAPEYGDALVYPDEIELEAANNRALLIDYGLQAVVAVDLDNGMRNILSSSTIPDSRNPIDYHSDIMIDHTRGRALVTDTVSRAVVAVELTTGERVIVSK